MNLLKIEHDFYERTGTRKNRKDLAFLLFGNTKSANISLSRLFMQKNKMVKIEWLKTISDFYEISIEEIINF